MAERQGKDFAVVSGMPDFDESVSLMWRKFIDIKKGCDQVGWLEIDAYQRTTGNRLDAWEVNLLVELDTMRRSNG